MLTCFELKAPAMPTTDHPLALCVPLLAQLDATVRALIMKRVECAFMMNNEEIQRAL
jgi:hypothetical protein